MRIKNREILFTSIKELSPQLGSLLQNDMELTPEIIQAEILASKALILSVQKYILYLMEDSNYEFESDLNWKVVGVDNHDRDHVADHLISKGHTREEAIAKAIQLNKDNYVGDFPGTYYKAFSESYRLSKGMEDLV